MSGGAVHTPCRVCLGGGWVCENHADHAWAGTANVEECCGGAGMPCGACNLEMASAGYVDRATRALKAQAEALAEALEDMIGNTLGAKVGASDGNTYAVYPPTGQALRKAQDALSAYRGDA